MRRPSFENRADKTSMTVRLDRCAASGRHTSTKSTGGRSQRSVRKVSRANRFIRFRSTARLAHFFEMAKPIRAKPQSFSLASTKKPGPDFFVGWLKTRLNSSGRSRRTCLGKLLDDCGNNRIRSPVGHGPWRVWR